MSGQIPTVNTQAGHAGTLQYPVKRHPWARWSLAWKMASEQNGKRVVYKKDVESQFPFSKTVLNQFAVLHPKEFDQYKSSAISRRNVPLSDEQFGANIVDGVDLDILANINALESIPSGRAEATKYEDWALSALSSVFFGQLRRPQKQVSRHEGRKRLDILFEVSNGDGFFADLRAIYNFKVGYAVFECKNYSDDIANPEFDQLLGRLGKRIGSVGIILCRKLTDGKRALKRCKDALSDKDHLDTLLTPILTHI